MHIFYLYFKSIEQGPVCIVHSLIKLSKSEQIKKWNKEKNPLLKMLFGLFVFVCKKSDPICVFL